MFTTASNSIPTDAISIHWRILSVDDVDRRTEVELEPRFGRNLQVLFPAGRNRSSQSSAGESADPSSFASSSNPADEGSQSCATHDFLGGLLTFSRPLLLGIAGDHLVLTVLNSNGV